MCLVKIFSFLFFLNCIIKTSGSRNTAATIVKIRQGSLALQVINSEGQITQIVWGKSYEGKLFCFAFFS